MSVIPRCTSVGAALSAQTLGQALRAFFGAAVESVVAIFTESFISLAAVLGMFTFCFCFAVAGGVGAPCEPGFYPRLCSRTRCDDAYVSASMMRQLCSNAIDVHAVVPHSDDAGSLAASC